MTVRPLPELVTVKAEARTVKLVFTTHDGGEEAFGDDARVIAFLNAKGKVIEPRLPADKDSEAPVPANAKQAIVARMRIMRCIM